MPIRFKEGNQPYNVREEHMVDFAKDHPDAYAILKDTSGKEWKVRASKYFKFQTDQMHLDPANPFPTSTIGDSPYKEEESQAVQQVTQTTTMPISIPSVPSPLKKEEPEGGIPGVSDFKTFSEEHPMGMNLSSDAKIPFKAEEKLTTSYQDAIPAEELAMAKAGAALQAEYDKKAVQQIEDELADVNAKLAVMEKEYFNSADYLKYMAVSGAGRAVGNMLPSGTVVGALAFKDPFMFAPKELIDLQKKKTALMQAKEHKAVADEINKNNDYEGKSFRWDNIVTGAKQWGKETLRSFDPSYRSTELLFDKISIGNKVAKGEELSAEEKDMLTVYALEDMMEQKYGSAKGDYGYIAGYGAPMMLEFMLQLAVSPGKGLAKASMTGAEKYAATVTKNLIKKYGATAVRKNLLRAAAYTAKQTARLAGAGANSVIAANTSQAPALVEGVAERMAGKVIGERDEQGNVIGTSFIDRKSPARAIYEQEATMAIENFTEAMFEGLGVGKMVSGAMSKAGGKLAGTKIGQKLVSSKGASYMAELMEKTSSTEWYKAFDKIRKAGHLGNAPEELLEEYAAIPLRHGMGVAETDMTMFEELTDPETFYSTAAGLSLGMGGMTMLQVAPASVSAGSDLIGYSRRKYFATSADKALHSADIGGASVFGEEWAYITPVIEAFTEEEIGNGMTQLINAQPTAEKKQAILNYMEALQEYRGANTMFEKMKQERVADDKKLAAIEARKEGYSTRNAQEIAAVKRRMEQMSSLYGQDLEDIISQYAEPSDFLRAIDGNVSEGTLAIATEYVNLKETYEGILDRMSDDTEARVQAMRNRVQARTNRQTGNIITAQIADEQGNVATDEMGNPLSFYVVDADLTISDGAVSMPSEGSAIVRGSDGKMQMLPASRIVNPIAQSKEAVEALIAEFEERIRTEEQMRNEAELSGVDPVEVESEAQEATSEEIAVQETPAPTRSAEQIAVELTKTEAGQELKELIDQYVRTDEDPEHVEQQIMAEYPEHAELAMEYYRFLTAPATEAPATEVPTTEAPATEVSATEAPTVPTPRVIRNKDNDLDVDAMIANGVTPEQMAEDLTAEFSNDDSGLALSTAQEYLAQVQEERAKTKSIIAKNGSLRKKEQFWSNVVGILTPQAEAPVTETPQAETPQAEVPVEAQNANAKWQAAPKVYGRETTLRVKGMRLRGRYVVAPAGVATGSHTADFKDNPDFIHDEQGRSRNPRDYSQASNQATTQEIAGNFALQNMQIVSPDGIVYDGNGRQIAGDIAAQNGTDGAYLEDLMDRADEFGFTPEQIQGMEHPRVYFEVAPGQLDYSAQTFDKFNAPEMKAPSAVELGAAMGQVLSDETFNRLADTIKQSDGLSAVYKSKPLQEAIAYILRDASDVKDVTTATLPQYYNAETRTLTEAGRNLLEACLLGKIFADNPQVLALLPKLPNKVMSKVAQAMPELAANLQMGEYALKDELANALTLVYEASQSGTSVNDYATQQDWTKGGSATDIFGKTVVMLAKALNGEIEGAELADVVRAYNVKAVDVVTGQGSMFENPTREQMLQEVINYYMKGEVATQEEEIATQEEEVATEESAPATEESAPQQEEAVAQPKTRVEKVNAMSDEEFSALLASNDLEAMRAYEQELHAMLGIDEAEEASKKKLRAKYVAINAEFGDFDNAPESVRNEFNKAAEEHEQKYSPTKVNDRWSKLRERILEVEAEEAKAKAEAEKQAKEEYKKTAYNGFLAEKTPMGAAKADKALNKQYRVDGKINTVAGFIEAWSEEGPMELRVRQNGNKSLYLVNGYDFGKTAYDYAQYLQSKKQQETAEEETSPSSDSGISEKVETAREMLKEFGKARAEWEKVVTKGGDMEEASKVYDQKLHDFRNFLMTLSAEELETVSSIDSTAEEEVKKEERRRHHQAGLAEDYEKALSSQGEITPVAPKAKGSIFDATVKDETRPVFGGVYHKDGTAVATDGRILIEEKDAYEQEKEGQLVDKRGNVIEGQRFPNWKGVIPKDVEAFEVSMESLRSFVEGVRQDAKKKGKKEADVTVVVKLPNGNFAYFELPHLAKFTNTAYRLGATELMLSAREEAPLLVQTEKGTAMLMPRLRASEEMYAYEISGNTTEKTTPAEQKAESVSHEELVEQNKQKLSTHANRDLNVLIKKIKEAMPHLQARVERTEESSEERQEAEAELKEWSAVLEAAETLLAEHKNGSWKKQFAVPLSESKELSIEDVNALFESLNGDKAVGELFEKVYAVAKTLGLKIKISDQLSTAQGNAGNDGIVKYAASLFYLPHSDQERANTLLHELIHTCTMYATGLHSKRNNGGVLTSLYDGLPQQIKDACAELEEIYNNIKNDKRVAGEYGITSVNEMVAELSNPVFREKMKEISLWGKIVGAIKRLFGFEALAPEGSEVSNALAEAERVLEKMLDNFDKSTYDAIRDKLQQTGRGRSNAVLGERLNAFARSAEEFEATQKEAVEKIGIVMPGLNEAELDIEDVPRHDFTGRGIDAIHKAEQWAKENLIGEHVYREGTDTEFKYDVTEDAVGKFLSSSSTKESDNLGVHLAVLKRLPQVINASIEAEIHPDYAKVNRTRSAENGVKNPDMLVHRFYGAVRIDGKIYLAKTTIQEFKGEANEAYDYKITEVKLIVSGSSTSNARTNPTSISAAKVLKDVEKSYDKGKKLLEESEKIAEEETLPRQGDGRYTDEELALINDPAARLYGESFRTKKQQKQYAERVRNHMRKKANELAEKLHLPVEIIESEEDMAKLKGQKANAKGWYEVKSGKIVLVLPNNESVADIVETVLHEGVAHLGLRKLFGKQFTQFLDNVYNHAEQSIREKIDEIARKNKVSTRTATEEYLASLAETTDFENINAKWWSQIKRFFLDMLHTIGFDYKGGTISDSELRYILWRSHENLKEPNPRFNVFSQAKDIVKQNKLKAEEKQAKERRRILSLGKTDSNPLVADRVNEEETPYIPTPSAEEQDIVDAAKADGTYMKAPNGEPTNLNEKQWAQVRTKAFKEWFGDWENDPKNASKVVDENGEPMVVYHGSEEDFKVFDKTKGRANMDIQGMFFSPWDDDARGYGSNVRAFYLNIRKPANENTGYKALKKFQGQNGAGIKAREYLVSVGYDGLNNEDQEFVAFDSNQIKSATDNVGTFDAENADIRFRMGDANNPNETAQRVYNEEMLSARFLAKESMVDYLAALDSLQRIIAEKGGKITSFQDAYSRMLALSSRNKQEIDLFDYSVMPQLTKAIGEILGRTGKINWESPEAKTLQRYVKVKHGIERDRDMAVRKALPAIADMKFKEQFAEINQRIEASTLRSEYEALIKERADMRANPAKYGLLTAEQIEGSLEAEWYKRTEEIRAEEGTWKEKQQKMDNAIAEVFGLDQAGLNTFGLELTEDYSGITETMVNEGLLTGKEVRKDRYAARKKAYEFVEQYEEQIGQDKADGLWNTIKAVSGFALEKQRQCGLVSAKYVADCNKRFEFYVPLRGFNDEVAHDVYDYLDEVYNNNNNNPVQTAEGRESEAGNPFANLMNIGYRSITAGNHNLAVQAFWNLANRKDVKGFLVPSRVWHLTELTPEQQDVVREELRGIADLSNDDILPYLPENASAEEIQDLLDDFEETMKGLKAMGYAYQGNRKARQELRTLSKAEENAHRVKVYMNGEVRYVTVVGNPRAAQALNGKLNPEQADWAALKGIQNFLAGAFTSQNPSFALANLVRDTQHANMRAFITEDTKYWKALSKKQAKLWRLGTIMKMLAAYENSIGNTGRHGWGETLDPKNEMHMRFKRFMEQGGATGFTFSRKQHENLEKLAKMAENVEGKSTPGQGFAVGEFFDFIRTFTEASELVNRFAAYETSLEMGRTEQQAIRDAKEITLNFNRKGAGRATYNASRASGNKAYTNVKYSAVNGLANLSQFGRDNLIFWNASVQGAYQLWSMLKKHPVKTFIAYGALPYTVAAFGLPLLNAWLCGGDDDKYYDELPEYERQRNICIKIPGTKGWFKIPLDPATQKIWAIGDATGAVMRGKKQFNLWNDIGANFVGLFSPVDIYWGDKNQNIVQRVIGVGSSFIPTLIQPLAHVGANRDWKGKPLENNSRYLDHLPSYKKAFKSDKASLTELSKWMNEWANEDADTYKVGPLDFASPGVMEELLFGYTGGYGQAALAAVETAWSLVSDEARGKFQLDKQPIINRFWVEGDPGQTKRSIFMNYNREVGDFMEEVEQRRSALNRDIKDAAIRQDDTDYGEAVDAREKFFNSADWKKYVKLKTTDAQVRQEAKGGIENASDITASAMLEAIEMIHDGKAFEADEQ